MSDQKPPTVREALQAGARKLTETGIDTAALDMSLLIAEAIGLDRMGVYLNFDRPLNQTERQKIRALFDRRMRREPIAYILGRREFHGLTFEVNPSVLIPRPETEHLVETAIDWLKEFRSGVQTSVCSGTPVIADIGVGSGAIAVSIAHAVPTCRIIATDVSPDSIEVARRNAEKHGVADRIEFGAGELFEPIHEPLDAILSNPPYVPETDRATLAPDVIDYEPHAALFSGPDGLDCIRELIAQAPRHLKPGGLLLIEIGAGQSLAVETLLAQTGSFQSIGFIPDYAGIDRVAKAIKR
ncbi:peptide chain release factor N(5)-glutamine methyltransferase [bacterium]|nr:peptide chain release factor N(5)-glutamine methyltransferase [bacterium]